jgi:two-component system sensor histidine kinase PilS (NtrC family)
MAHYMGRARMGLQEIDLAQTLMYVAIYLSTVLFCQLLARRAQQSQALADERGLQLAEMAQMNELIIKRLRTGVILLGPDRQIIVCNEAAGQLSQNPIEPGRPLPEILPMLDARLQQWLEQPDAKPNALVLHEGGPEVIPRFVRVNHHAVHWLVFLEDSRVFSGRADELQLANLGRLSASIAHEIRNPLAAISYAQQLLAESAVLNTSDKRLLDIIGTQSHRMDGIINNVLKLAKREPAYPQILSLNKEVGRVIREHLATHPDDRASISFQPDTQETLGLFDALHLQQVLNILIDNALVYGRFPERQARVVLTIHTDNGQPSIEVTDFGPGISAALQKHLFDPFMTGSDHGTGLGLYIARQLAEANQAHLEYRAEYSGGSRFTLRLSNGHALLNV